MLVLRVQRLHLKISTTSLQMQEKIQPNRASRESTNWQHVVWTGQVTEVNSGLKLYLDADQKCWIDNIKITQQGFTSNLIVNGDFESGSNSWSFIGNHDRSRIEPNMGISNSTALALVGNMTRIVDIPMSIYFGDPTENHASSESFSTTNGQTYIIELWFRRTTGRATLHAVAGAWSAHIPIGNYGTPGRKNSTPVGGFPFRISNLTSEWTMGHTGVANTVKMQITNPTAISNATLHYRVVPRNDYEFSDGHYSTIPMSDNGIPPDITAGDGEYAATIPAISR